MELEFAFMMLLALGLFVGLPLFVAVVLYKLACSWVSEAQASREEAQAGRLEAENDALRLRMLREKRARLKQTPAPGLPPADSVVINPNP